MVDGGSCGWNKCDNDAVDTSSSTDSIATDTACHTTAADISAVCRRTVDIDECVDAATDRLGVCRQHAVHSTVHSAAEQHNVARRRCCVTDAPASGNVFIVVVRLNSLQISRARFATKRVNTQQKRAMTPTTPPVPARRPLPRR